MQWCYLVARAARGGKAYGQVVPWALVDHAEGAPPDPRGALEDAHRGRGQGLRVDGEPPGGVHAARAGPHDQQLTAGVRVRAGRSVGSCSERGSASAGLGGTLQLSELLA